MATLTAQSDDAIQICWTPWSFTSLCQMPQDPYQLVLLIYKLSAFFARHTAQLNTNTATMHLYCISKVNRSCETFSSLYYAPSPMDAADVLYEPLIKLLAFDRHLHLVEWILQDEVCVQVIYPADPIRGDNSLGFWSG